MLEESENLLQFSEKSTRLPQFAKGDNIRMYLIEIAPESEQGMVLDLGDFLGIVKTISLFTT
jgi:hypothetical protein